jgi:putative transposase
MGENKRRRFKNIYWQNGYGAFCVNPSQVDTAITYIATQKERHIKKCFQNE